MGFCSITRFFSAGSICLSALLVYCLSIAGCASGGNNHRLHLEEIEPLRLGDKALNVDSALKMGPAPDLLVIDDEMKAFVETFTDQGMSRRERLHSLHRAFNTPGLWPIRYDAAVDGSAKETFYAQRGNCLAYANLIVAIAREAGLDARYHWMEVRPEWTRMGELVAVRLHVNALVRTSRKENFLVDIDPLQVWEVAGSRDLSDDDAKALHLNNLAMKALLNNDLETAWSNLVQAIRLGPALPPLWVNLGVLYGKTGQLEAAQRSYQESLRLNPGERSAMINLVSLYEQLGLEQQKAHWQKRVESYRANNPFYHAYLGDLAFEQGDMVVAGIHYDQAVALQPDNSGILYTAGLIQFKLGELESAEHYLAEAVKHATLTRDLRLFRRKLDQVRQARLSESAVAPK